VLEDLVEDNTVWSSFGLMHKRGLLDNPYFINKDEYIDKETLHSKSYEYIRSLQSLFLFLWLIRDNSCNVGFSVMFKANGRLANALSSSHVNTTADCSFVDTTFTLDEIKQSRLYAYEWGKFASVAHLEERKLKDPTFARGYYNKVQVNYNELNRLHRALAFLQSARASDTLQKKIMFYALILECLFSANDKSEIQHKISERVALYIGTTPTERSDLFDKVKKYYSIRSSYVHGQSMDSKFKDNEVLKKMAIEFDSLIRIIFIKIIDEDSNKFLLADKQLGAWFQTLLFNSPLMIIESEEVDPI
jgi:hypothetical protein